MTATASMLPCQAANLYWDTNGATAGSGNAAGTWDTGTNWSSNVAGTAVTAGWVNGQSAVFSAGTDATVATAKAITLSGTIATPSILMEEVELVNLTGGTVDITGGSVFNTSVLGTATGRSLNWTSTITGNGALTLAVNGDTAAGANGNTIYALSGTNDFTGDVTITSGIVNANSGLGNAANKVILNGGGLVDPNLNLAFARNLEIGASGGTIRNYGGVTNFRLQGTLSGSGTLRRTDGGTTVLTGSGTGFTGALNLQRGTTQIGDGTQTSNLLPNTSGITIGEGTTGATLRYQLDSSFTMNTPVTLLNGGSTFVWQGKDALDTLTRTTTLGAAANVGTIRVNSGTLAAGSGADFRAANFQVASTPASSATGEIGVLSFLPGSNGVTRFFDIGQGGGCAGKVDQSGGLVTIEAGGSGFRIGHWDNGVTPGSVYNLSGGTLDASITAVNVGWDGKAAMTVGGGASTATLKAASLQVDANGNSATYDDSFTLSANGVAEIAGAIASASANDRVFLNGGTLRPTGSATWSAPFTLNPATTTAIDLSSGFTTTLSSVLEGTGNLSVSGAGTLVVNSTNLFTGSYTQTSGTLAGTGTLSAGPTTINAVVSPGTAAVPVGTLNLGADTMTTALGGNLLFDLSADGFALGDLISVGGNLNLTGATISPVFTALPSEYTHTVMYYTGTLAGTPTLNTNVQVRGLNFALDTSLPGEVRLAVTGTANPGNLVWGGDGSGNAWNLNSTANWGGGQKFFQYDNVVFDDSGNNAANISITGNLTPGSVTIDGTNSYTFSGTGSLVGSPTLTKNSTGDLTILNDNKFGTVILGSGNLIVGNGGSTGSIGDTGSITIASGTTLEFNRAGSLTYARPATAGSSGTLVKKGSGTLTLGAGATLLPTNLVVNGGTLNVQGGGFSGNRMEGAGQVTVNAGATMILASGFAHTFGGDNGTMTEAFTINQGTLTVNQEQYFKALTLNGATVNGSSEIRSVNGHSWLVTGSAPSTIASGVNNVNATTTWTVENVTGSTAPDLIISGVINNNGTGATTKVGVGTLRATGANTTNGAININAGTFEAGSDRALGWGSAIGNAAVGTTTVAAGAALDINGVTVNEVVTLNNGGLLTNSNTTTPGTLSNGLAGVRITAVGTGYTAAPTLAVDSGGGNGTATAAVASGALTNITTTTAGTGYTTAPNVVITGAGTGATATAVISQLVLNGSDNKVGGPGVLAVNGIMTGTGSYSKVGAGILNLGTGGSTFTGNMTVESGTVNVNAVANVNVSSALGAMVGTRTITLNGGSLAFTTNNVFGNGGAALAANLPGIVVNQGATLTTNNYNVVGPITLNGGILTDTRTGTPGGYQAWEFKGGVSTGGTTPSLITSQNGWGNHMVGTVTFNVADVTAGMDLTVTNKLLNSSADNGGGVAHLTKTGPGTMNLNSANSYTGTTTVNAGTLGGAGSVAGPLIVNAGGTIAPGTSAGTFGAGATTLAGTYACEIDGANKDTLAVTGNLDLTGSTLAVSVLNAPTQATYVILTYTGTLTGTFANVSGLPAGYSVAYQAGQVVITNAAGDAYGNWASTNGISGAGGNVDSDKDGIPNGIEFVIGGDPSGPGSDSNALLPTITMDANYMTIVFRRTDESVTYNPHVQYSTSMQGAWTDAVNGQPVATPVVITTDNDFYATGIDRVTVKVPRALAAPGTKLFGRLFVNIP